MPQIGPLGEPRTAVEQFRFTQMLRNVNWLFLGARVLVLQDLSYLSRFWWVSPLAYSHN